MEQCEGLTQRIDELARRFRLLKGKWMAFPPEELVDTTWECVARAALRKQLPGVSQVKVSSTSPGKSSYAICVYTHDYLDRQHVESVRDALRSAGVAPDLPLFYKPDIYTHLDIYSKNELGLKPSILRDGPRDEGRLPSASY